MKYSNYIHLIENLRRLPSQGQTSSNADETRANKLADATKAASDQLDALIESFQTSTNAGRDFLDIINSMLTGLPAMQAGLAGVIAMQEKMAAITKKSVANVTQLEEKYKGLNKTFKVSSFRTNEIVVGLANQAQALETTIKQTTKYTQTLNRLLPMQSKNFANVNGANIQNKANIKTDYETLNVLQRNLDMTEEQAAGYLSFAAIQGKSSKEVLASAAELAKYLEEGGMVGVLPEITNEIAALGSDLRLQYGRLGGNLSIAVIKARQLGISVADLHKTGEGFLNIEESVGKELEYQLLTGNRLLTQDGESLTAKYREATLMGDSAKQADLMNRLLTTQGGELETNLFARQQMADLLNIDVRNLGQMLEKQKLIKKYGLGAETLNLSVDELVGKLKEQDASAEDIKEFVKKQTNQMTTAEIANEKLQNIADNTLLLNQAFKDGTLFEDTRDKVMTGEFMGKLTDTVTTFGTIAQNAEIVKTIGQMSNFAVGLSTITDKLRGLGQMIPFVGTTMEQFVGKVNKFSERVGGVLTMDVPASAVPAAGSSNDFIWRPGTGMQKFSSADTVVGFKTGGGGGALAASGIGGGTDIDYNAMAFAIAGAMKNVQIVAGPDIYGASTMNNSSIAQV